MTSATAVTCACGGSAEVVETRMASHGIRRRRRCKTCSARWTTCEIRVDDVDSKGVRIAFLPRRKLTADEALALVATLIAGSES